MKSISLGIIIWVFLTGSSYIVGSENISSITSLTGMDLQEFLVFLNEQFVCNYNCTELKIYTEIHSLWEVYQKLHPE